MTTQRLMGEALREACVRLGMRFEGTGRERVPPGGPWHRPPANIEETLLAASRAGLAGDQETLDRLVTWLEVYGRWVNLGALRARLHGLHDPAVTTFWSAVALWPRSAEEEVRWELLVGFSGGLLVDLPAGDNTEALRRVGEDPLFRHGPLRVPAGFFRHCRDDLRPIGWSADQHPALRARIQMGATHRADLWAALEVDPRLDVIRLSTQVRAPLEIAMAVRADWDALQDGAH